MPWETGSGEGKYQYYPGGDRSATPKDAPSAVNVVVVPDVTLPKVRPFSPPPPSQFFCPPQILPRADASEILSSLVREAYVRGG